MCGSRISHPKLSIRCFALGICGLGFGFKEFRGSRACRAFRVKGLTFIGLRISSVGLGGWDFAVVIKSMVHFVAPSYWPE